jgi:SH3-like domain-containing protein
MNLRQRCSGNTLSKLGTGIRTVLVFFIVVLAATDSAYAVDYVSVADNAAVLYDAPSLKAKKIFVVSRYLPLEQVVNLDNWVKVRDSSGGLAWIEKRALSNKRFVVVTVALAAIRQAPDENAAVVAQVKQQVALEWLENTGTGWLKVRHLDGAAGYVKSTEVWGD